MATCMIRSVAGTPQALPPPYVGTVGVSPPTAAIIPQSKATIVANLGGAAAIAGIFEVDVLPGDETPTHHWTGAAAAYASAVPVDGVTLDKLGASGSLEVAASGIAAAQIAAGAVTSAKIGAGAVLPAALGAVTDGATVDQLGTGSVIEVTAQVGLDFGDGSDGAQTFDGVATILGMAPSGNVYTATRDLFLGSSTINAGVTLNMHGFRLFCSGTLTLAGTGVISNDGNAGAAGVGGAATNSGSVGIGTAGGAGGNNAVGSPGANQTNGFPGGAGVGGAGGAGTNVGGAAGTWAAAAAALGGARFAMPLLQGILLGQSGGIAALTLLEGGAGGGGGGSSVATATGGGGGGGGGVLIVSAYNLVNNGAIHATGGAGAAGSGTAGNGGGGGGGGGGLVIVATRKKSGAGTVTAAGGAGGALFGAGVAGAAGTAGVVVQVAV